MSAEVAKPSLPDRSRGRTYLWGGIVMCLLGIVAMFVQFGVLRQLIVPWYLPILASLGALLALWSVTYRVTVVRIVVLVLVGGLAGLEWYFLAIGAKLPAYEGPARIGEKIPAFTTTLAKGEAFTDENLRDGNRRVLVFFRGRW
jgi:hypothetical protein